MQPLTIEPYCSGLRDGSPHTEQELSRKARIARLLVAFALAGGVLAGAVTPAYADPPQGTFAVTCVSNSGTVSIVTYPESARDAATRAVSQSYQAYLDSNGRAPRCYFTP
jgi:hypothetical protein